MFKQFFSYYKTCHSTKADGLNISKQISKIINYRKMYQFRIYNLNDHSDFLETKLILINKFKAIK